MATTAVVGRNVVAATTPINRETPSYGLMHNVYFSFPTAVLPYKFFEVFAEVIVQVLVAWFSPEAESLEPCFDFAFRRINKTAADSDN
jgi:hypothetical protein